MFPTAVVPLQHDLSGRIARIQIHVGKQRVARQNLQRVRGVVEVVPMNAGNDGRLMCRRARIGRGTVAHPIPRFTAPRIAAIGAGYSAGRQCVLHPDSQRRAFRTQLRAERFRQIQPAAGDAFAGKARQQIDACQHAFDDLMSRQTGIMRPH